jgi:hypothetical protein
MSRDATDRAPTSAPPDVLLDVAYDGGALFLVLRNAGAGPAHTVRCVFDRKLMGADPERPVSELRLFRHLEFLAPGREIRTLLDAAESFLARERDPRFRVRIRFEDDAGERYARTIRHDLSIYRDLIVRL